MDNKLEYNNSKNRIKYIWNKNKKSEELISYCEEFFKINDSIDIEIYLIYLNTLVNLKKYDKAFETIENNYSLSNEKEIISFKLKLLFFLKKYDECNKYINSLDLDEENKNLAQKIKSQIKSIYTYNNNKIEEIKNEEVTDNIEKEDEDEDLTKEQLKKEEKDISIDENNLKIEEDKVESSTSKEEIYTNKKKKSKIKITIVLLLILSIIGVCFFIIAKKHRNININTDICLNNQYDIAKYKSDKNDILYELPLGKEFEFASYFDENVSKGKNKKVYVTYEVSDENIATITEDGFFKGKKIGNVDILTLNNKKVVDTIKVEVVSDTVVDNDIENSVNEDDIREVIKNYKNDYIQAINEGNYDIIEKYIVKDSPLEEENRNNIKNIYDKRIKEKLDSLEFVSINKVLDNEYLINVYETISMDEDGKEKSKKYDVFYDIIVQNDGEILIYEAKSRDITKKIEDKLSVEEAIEFCTKRLIEIGYYNESYGEANYYGTSEKENSKGFYYIVYDGGESYYVDPYKKNVHYIAPAGDGFSSPL